MLCFKIDIEARGEEISRKMHTIVSPENTTCTHLFPWGTDSNGQPYIQIDPDMVCPVYVRDNFRQVLSEVGQLLNIPESEGTALRQYMEGGEVVLSNLIPSTLQQFEPYFAPPPFLN